MSIDISAEIIIHYIIAFILGSVLGSFACCQAWRIHEKNAGKKLGKRSVCINCGEQLKWYDNIPIISWVMLLGKCRKCKAKIGKAEILSEIGLGLIFLAIAIKFSNPAAYEVQGIAYVFSEAQTYIYQPLILFMALIPFWTLLIYDAKWGELPVSLMLLEIPFAIAFQFASKGDILQIAISAGLLSSIYYLLYFFSKEKLVGGGDWILCISVGIFLGHWELAVIELFLSNFLASLAGIPQILKRQKKPIPFGPFLIISLIAIILISDYLLKFIVIY